MRVSCCRFSSEGLAGIENVCQPRRLICGNGVVKRFIEGQERGWMGSGGVQHARGCRKNKLPAGAVRFRFNEGLGDVGGELGTEVVVRGADALSKRPCAGGCG